MCVSGQVDCTCFPFSDALLTKLWIIVLANRYYFLNLAFTGRKRTLGCLLLFRMVPKFLQAEPKSINVYITKNLF